MENKPLIIGIIVVIIAIAGIALVVNKQNTAKQVASEQEDKAMMEQKAMEEKAMEDKKMEGGDSAMKKDAMKTDEAMEKDAMMKESSSSYVDFSSQVLADAQTAQKSGRKVVLFFHASWCPNCIAADKDFKANIGTDKFPSNVTLIKTNYDTQTELKTKYGITTQHTFVQIDSSGNQITKWISGDTSDLATKLK